MMSLNISNQSNNEKWIFPKFEMPSIWYNDEEIYNLLQTFKRPRHIDPIAFDFKINFWSNLLIKYASHHHVLIINEVQMQSIFTREFVSNGLTLKPLCAKTILQSLQMDGKLKEISAFESGSLIGKLITGVGWVIKAPLSWSYKKLSSVFYTESVSSQENDDHALGDLVIVDVVYDCLNEFMDWVVNHVDKHISPHLDVISLTDFNKLLINYFPHKTSRNLAQQLLINRRQIEIVTLPQSNVIKIDNETSENIQIVKFASSMDAPLCKIGLEKETIDQINGLVQLRALSVKLANDEKNIEEKLEKIKLNVRLCLRKDKKEEAKNHLKRGKLTEKVLERKRIQLQNVENMLMEIEASSDNIQVVKALSNAAGTLKARSMDVDSVHDAMAEIGDVLAEQEEINASIGAIGDGASNNDVTELEAELALLLTDQSNEGPILSKAGHLPDVPIFDDDDDLLSPINTASINNRLRTLEMDR